MPSEIYRRDLDELLSASINEIHDHGIKASLGPKLRRIYWTAYDRFLCNRTPADNRLEHELVVLRHFLRIGRESGACRPSKQPFCESEFLVGSCFCILHDTYFIPRITEADILEAVTPQEAERLRKLKEEQRRLHMVLGAKNAREFLADAATWNGSNEFLNVDETRRCLELIALHDIWKFRFPWPPSSDWLAVCCVEADALWPVSYPWGPRADIERQQGVESAISSSQLQDQAAKNMRTQLAAYRGNFDDLDQQFMDNTTMIRTREGAAILGEHKSSWGLDIWPC